MPDLIVEGIEWEFAGEYLKNKQEHTKLKRSRYKTPIKYSFKDQQLILQHSFIKIDKDIYAISNQNIGEFCVYTTLSKAKVYESRTGQKLLAKSYNGRKLVTTPSSFIATEINTLRHIKTAPDKSSMLYKVIESNPKSILLLPYLGKDLTNYFKQTRCSKKELLQLMIGCSEKVSQLHSGKLHDKGIPVLHRDIKPDNFTVNEGRIYLIDYGFSIDTAADQDGLIVLPQQKLGTPDYAAPEVYRGHYSFKTDIYALGIVFYKLLAISSRILNDSFNKERIVRLEYLIKKMRATDATSRPSADDVLLILLTECYHDNPDELCEKLIEYRFPPPKLSKDFLEKMSPPVPDIVTAKALIYQEVHHKSHDQTITQRLAYLAKHPKYAAVYALFYDALQTRISSREFNQSHLVSLEKSINKLIHLNKVLPNLKYINVAIDLELSRILNQKFVSQVDEMNEPQAKTISILLLVEKKSDELMVSDAVIDEAIQNPWLTSIFSLVYDLQLQRNKLTGKIPNDIINIIKFYGSIPAEYRPEFNIFETAFHVVNYSEDMIKLSDKISDQLLRIQAQAYTYALLLTNNQETAIFSLELVNAIKDKNNSVIYVLNFMQQSGIAPHELTDFMFCLLRLALGPVELKLLYIALLFEYSETREQLEEYLTLFELSYYLESAKLITCLLLSSYDIDLSALEFYIDTIDQSSWITKKVDIIYDFIKQQEGYDFPHNGLIHEAVKILCCKNLTPRPAIQEEAIASLTLASTNAKNIFTADSIAIIISQDPMLSKALSSTFRYVFANKSRIETEYYINISKQHIRNLMDPKMSKTPANIQALVVKYLKGEGEYGKFPQLYFCRFFNRSSSNPYSRIATHVDNQFFNQELTSQFKFFKPRTKYADLDKNQRKEINEYINQW